MASKAPVFRFAEAAARRPERFFSELHLGEMTQVVLGGIEGLVFSGCVITAIVVVRQAWVRSL